MLNHQETGILGSLVDAPVASSRNGAIWLVGHCFKAMRFGYILGLLWLLWGIILFPPAFSIKSITAWALSSQVTIRNITISTCTFLKFAFLYLEIGRNLQYEYILTGEDAIRMKTFIKYHEYWLKRENRFLSSLSPTVGISSVERSYLLRTN